MPAWGRAGHLARSSRRALRTLLPRVLDTTVELAVLAFAVWTLLYHAATLLDVGGDVVWWTWCGLVVPAAAAWVWVRGRRAVAGPSEHHGTAALIASAVAVLASFVVRPDLDDASYVVRSRVVQESGSLTPADVIFSNGSWPAMMGQSPYVPSFEAFWGMAGRVTGTQAASLLYLVHVPLASFAAVWALWTLLRAWRARRPLTGLVLGCLLLLLGGFTHASWGNLHLARIWQGKVVLLAVVVPLLYAWTARWWTARRGARLAPSALVAAASVAGVGLTPVAVFVVPAVVVAAAAVGVVARRWSRTGVLLLVGATYPLAVGLVVRSAGNVAGSAGGPPPLVLGSPVPPWERTLGTGWPAAVVVLAALLALVGALVPAAARAHGRVGPWSAAATVLAGSLVLVPPFWDAAVRVMGTDLVAWRLVWVVPVPALVGLLGSPPRRGRRDAEPIVAIATAGALSLGGVPLWSASNDARLVSWPVWKMPPDELSAGRWIAAHPPEGRYLAPAWVVAAAGATSAAQLPVGSRADYLESYSRDPAAQVPERGMLQQWAEGISVPDPRAVADALDTLDVATVCLRPALAEGYLSGPQWVVVSTHGSLTCWGRPARP